MFILQVFFLIITENVANMGNIDMALLVNNHIYIVKFKMVGKDFNPGPGLALP